VGILISWCAFAAGAILQFGVLVNATGVILMIAGTIGFVLSLIFWESWGGFARNQRRRSVVELLPIPRDREVL